MRKNIIIVLIFVIVKSGIGNKYADKKYYLIDSLNLSSLTKQDSVGLDSCLKKFHSNSTVLEKIDALNGICEGLTDPIWMKYQKLQYDLIETSLAQQNTKLIEKKLKGYLANALNNFGVAFSTEGDQSKAIQYWNKSIKIRFEINDSIGIGTSYLNMATYYDTMGEYDKSETCYQNCVEIFKGIDLKKGIVRGLYGLAAISSVKGESLKALRFCKEGIKFAQSFSDISTLAEGYFNLSAYLFEVGSIKESLEKMYKARKLYKHTGNLMGESHCLNGIGRIFSTTADTVSALEYYLKCKKLCTQIGNETTLLVCRNSIAGILLEKGDTAEALSEFKKLYEIDKQSGNLYSQAASLNNIASV